jgi:hypothetical protein
VGNPFILKECSVLLHALDIHLIGFLIMKSLIVMDLCGVLPCFVHGFGDKYPFLFRELEVDITELRSFMSDTSTVCVSNKVCMVDLVILFSIFLIIVLWKWRRISESYE